jgi:hypothetical protein
MHLKTVAVTGLHALPQIGAFYATLPLGRARDQNMSIGGKRTRYQSGYLYEHHGAFFLRYYITANGQRVQKSELLHEKDDIHFSKKCPAVQKLRQEVLKRINGNQPAKSDTTVVEFWTDTYLPFIQEHKKHSTVDGYKQIWNQ